MRKRNEKTLNEKEFNVFLYWLPMVFSQAVQLHVRIFVKGFDTIVRTPSVSKHVISIFTVDVVAGEQHRQLLRA